MTELASGEDLKAVEALAQARASVVEQIEKRVVGQRDVVEHLLISLFSRGHCLFVGVPGLAKTLLISTLILYAATGRSWWVVATVVLLPDLFMVGYLGGHASERSCTTSLMPPRRPRCSPGLARGNSGSRSSRSHWSGSLTSGSTG